MQLPFESTLIEATLRDSTYKFFDDISTSKKESLQDIVVKSFKETVVILKELTAKDKLEWWKSKDTRINHLLKQAAFSRMHLNMGGGRNMINATTEQHGPSWRMIVSLTAKTEAYGVYPGGQNGNPGSKFYDNFVDQWGAGKYYALWMMTKDEIKDNRVKWVMNFSN